MKGRGNWHEGGIRYTGNGNDGDGICGYDIPDCIFQFESSSGRGRRPIQEVFLRALKSRPSFESEEHRKAWLIRVTINVCHTALKSAWVRHTQALPEELAAKPVTLDCVHDEVLNLPVKYRNVIQLFYYEGYSVKELASLLGKKESTAKSPLRRGRERLRERLRGECDKF